jgi:hypothetical protein
MKLALIILVVWACAVHVTANPVEDPETEINRIAGVIDEIVKLMPDENLGWVNIKTIVFKGFDSICIAKKVQAHKLQRYFNFEDITNVTKITEPNTFLIIGTSLLPCTTDRDELVSLLFDAANILIRVHRLFKADSPQFDLPGMPCRIDYAIKHNYLDLSKYPEISYSHDSEVTKECEDQSEGEIESVKDFVVAKVPSIITNCLSQEYGDLLKVLYFKYAMLVYLGVSEEHMREIKHEFSNEFMSRHDQQLNCFLLEETDNAITDAR